MKRQMILKKKLLLQSQMFISSLKEIKIEEIFDMINKLKTKLKLCQYKIH